MVIICSFTISVQTRVAVIDDRFKILTLKKIFSPWTSCDDNGDISVSKLNQTSLKTYLKRK